MTTGKVEFDVPSMQAGARSAATLGKAVSGSARRVSGLPIPEGAPPDVAGALQSASSKLNGASLALSSQGRWLNTQAQLALLADAIGPFVFLLTPPLLRARPVAVRLPVTKGKPDLWAPGALADALSTYIDKSKFGKASAHNPANQFSIGFGVKFVSSLEDLGKAVIALGRGPGGPIVKNDQTVRLRQDYIDGLKWAAKHPGDFAKSAAGSFASADEYKKHGINRGLGANGFDAFSMFFGLGEIATVAKTARAAGKTAKLAPSHQTSRTVANTARAQADNASSAVLHPKRPGETDAEFRLREEAHAADQATTKSRAETAEAIEQRLKDRLAESTRARNELIAKLQSDLHKTPAEIRLALAKAAATSVVTEPPKHAAQHRKEAHR